MTQVLQEASPPVILLLKTLDLVRMVNGGHISQADIFKSVSYYTKTALLDHQYEEGNLTIVRYYFERMKFQIFLWISYLVMILFY